MNGIMPSRTAGKEINIVSSSGPTVNGSWSMDSLKELTFAPMSSVMIY